MAIITAKNERLYLMYFVVESSDDALGGAT
ncbi:hypothetical protein K151_1456 [Proteus hauseri ZMd44]|nr:hypothetical protein K151_1456 [Proteus hauseri ZMd44]